jgi:hypothetical protein
MSDARTTQLLAAMLDTPFVAAATSYRSVGAAIQSGSAFEEAFSRSLSIALVGASASIFEDSMATSAVSLDPLLISRIPLVPLIGYGISVVSLWSVKDDRCSDSSR